jgi:DNA-binding GntR family transcriptional regulator
MPRYRRADGTVSVSANSVSRVLVAIQRATDQPQRPYPKLRELAQETGLSLTTVHAAVTGLIEDGIVTHHHGYGRADTKKGRS